MRVHIGYIRADAPSADLCALVPTIQSARRRVDLVFRGKSSGLVQVAAGIRETAVRVREGWCWLELCLC